MFITRKTLILASASPRRRRLLTDIGLKYQCIPADIDETPFASEKPIDFARRMALTKAETIAKTRPDAYILAADTVVTIDGLIIGKPATAQEALKTLQRLQGTTHSVVTGIALLCVDDHCLENTCKTTEVEFSSYADQVLVAYISTGEPLDKAGSYGIQGKGGFLVKNIEGSCSNAIGMPMNTCVRLLLSHGVISALSATTDITLTSWLKP